MEAIMTIMRPGQPTQTKSVDLPEKPGYQTLKALVEPLLDNEDMAHVSVLVDGKRTDMFVDDMGLHKPDLKLNEEATKIYHAAAVARGEDVSGASVIVGTAILFSRQVWF